MTEPAPEGSLDRRWARRTLHVSACQAAHRGCSYYEWILEAPQSELDAVTQKDLDTIFNLAWSKNSIGYL